MSTTAQVLLAVACATSVVALVAIAVAIQVRRRFAHESRSLAADLERARREQRNEDQIFDAIRAMTSESFREHSLSFLDLATQRQAQIEASAEAHWDTQGRLLVGKLDEYSRRLAELEKARQGDAGSLRQAIETLSRQSHEVRSEAAKLSSALRDNKVRGVWGEMQLKRVLELSGMSSHVDFVEQVGVSDSIRSGRPDVVVHLPNDRKVVIDAKAPLIEFLKASDESDPQIRSQRFAAHGEALAGHVKALSQRDYSNLVRGSVDFVVLFVPGDTFLTSALDARPELLENAFAQDVVLAAPSTLLAFLRGVASGWQERQISEQSEEIARVGRELHERMGVFVEHVESLGGSLGRAVTNYNQLVGSLEARVLVSSKRLEELGASSGRSIGDPEHIDELVRPSGTPGGSDRVA